MEFIVVGAVAMAVLVVAAISHRRMLRRLDALNRKNEARTDGLLERFY